MKLPKIVETMLNDKNVLYIVAFLAIMNFFGYIILRDSYLLSTLLLTNFITLLSRNFIVNKEGFDATAETDATNPDAVAATATAGADATKSDAANGANATAKKPVVASGVAGAGGASNKASKKVASNASSTKMATVQKPNSQKEPMTELSPASLDDEDDLPVNNRVDYAKTLEKAYDNLEDLVGKDGVNGLTSQTTVLMDQQQKLMENMKSMEPLLKTAQSFLDKFESSSMGKLFEKIPGMSSMFGGASGAQPSIQNGNVKGAAA
jgi:hypothetical protein